MSIQNVKPLMGLYAYATLTHRALWLGGRGAGGALSVAEPERLARLSLYKIAHISRFSAKRKLGQYSWLVRPIAAP